MIKVVFYTMFKNGKLGDVHCVSCKPNEVATTAKTLLPAPITQYFVIPLFQLDPNDKTHFQIFKKMDPTPKILIS